METQYSESLSVQAIDDNWIFTKGVALFYQEGADSKIPFVCINEKKVQVGCDRFIVKEAYSKENIDLLKK